MRIYVISDTHFGHKMLNKQRPEGWEEMIIHNWNEIVRPEDTVFHLGDFSLGKYKDYSITESIVMWRNKLNGSICLIRGNHDKQNCYWYMTHGFQGCFDSVEFKFKGYNLLLTHEPFYNLRGNNYNIHGHIHSDMREEEFRDEILLHSMNNINVAVEFTRYRPWDLNQILKFKPLG